MFMFVGLRSPSVVGNSKQTVKTVVVKNPDSYNHWYCYHYRSLSEHSTDWAANVHFKLILCSLEAWVIENMLSDRLFKVKHDVQNI